MTIQLTPQQQQAIDTGKPALPRVIDPRTNDAYILVPETEYESIRDLLNEERQQRVIHEVAMRNAIGRMDESP